GVGYIDTAMDFVWPNRHVDTRAGTVVFVTTDGLIDQIGGPKEIAFGKRRVREALRASRELPTAALSQAVLDAHLAWQGHNRRRDDLTYFCFRVR
ncbi:SpoIIE family protein phosphatase, partial [Cupriavidus sp. OTU4054]